MCSYVDFLNRLKIFSSAEEIVATSDIISLYHLKKCVDNKISSFSLHAKERDLLIKTRRLVKDENDYKIDSVSFNYSTNSFITFKQDNREVCRFTLKDNLKIKSECENDTVKNFVRNLSLRCVDSISTDLKVIKDCNNYFNLPIESGTIKADDFFVNDKSTGMFVFLTPSKKKDSMIADILVSDEIDKLIVQLSRKQIGDQIDELLKRIPVNCSEIPPVYRKTI